MRILNKDLELPGAENFGREISMQLQRQLNSLVGQHPPGHRATLVQKVLAGDDAAKILQPVGGVSGRAVTDICLSSKAKGREVFCGQTLWGIIGLNKANVSF